MNRREFFRGAASLSALGLSGWKLPSVSAAETTLKPGMVQFSPEVEPLVRFLEDTPRDRLVEEIVFKIRKGLNYREVLTALLLAGVRNIQPRPVGFKFHAVLVVNSAHLASMASPDSDRWLPIIWAVDQFKSSQARDVAEGNWTMAPVESSKLPTAAQAKNSLIDALEHWDETKADSAIVALVRTGPRQEILEILARFAARDFREIGHKVIYVANSYRTLQVIGWQHAEPVLRSVVYALLDHEGTNPADRDAPADRPGRRNLTLAKEWKAGWEHGMHQDVTNPLLDSFRKASAEEVATEITQRIDKGISARNLWDGIFQGAAELLMRQPGLISLHAVTATNAFHFCYQMCRDDFVRRYLLLQNAAFLPLYRGAPKPSEIEINHLEPISPNAAGGEALEEIFAELSSNKLKAARKALAFLTTPMAAREFMDRTRLLIFNKGRDSHDYKFSAAVLEDFHHLAPSLQNRYLAASVFSLRGSGGTDNELIKQIRTALK